MDYSDAPEIEADIVVVGGGSAGSAAAIYAQRALPRGRVVLLEKAHVKRSGAIAIGMDGLNNAIVPGHATPEQYVKEITMANDGIVNQRAVWEYAVNSYPMIQELDSASRSAPRRARRTWRSTNAGTASPARSIVRKTRSP